MLSSLKTTPKQIDVPSSYGSVDGEVVIEDCFGVVAFLETGSAKAEGNQPTEIEILY